MTRRKLLGATLFAAAFAGALGFGATQAVASPETAVVRACDPVQCRRDCMRIPGQTAGGSCVNGVCVCSGGGNPPK
jgi:nitrous oxide reductase